MSRSLRVEVRLIFLEGIFRGSPQMFHASPHALVIFLDLVGAGLLRFVEGGVVGFLFRVERFQIGEVRDGGFKFLLIERESGVAVG
jgi:hypothetical protein